MQHMTSIVDSFFSGNESNPFKQMEFSIKLYTIKSRWSIVSTEGSQVIISKNYRFAFLKINVVLANSTDRDEMPQNVAFHLGLHCLMKYPFMAFQSAKG